MRIRVTYFAAARELATCSDEEIAIAHDELALSELVVSLAERHPRLAAYLSRMRFAVNGEFALSMHA